MKVKRKMERKSILFYLPRGQQRAASTMLSKVPPIRIHPLKVHPTKRLREDPRVGPIFHIAGYDTLPPNHCPWSGPPRKSPIPSWTVESRKIHPISPLTRKTHRLPFHPIIALGSYLQVYGPVYHGRWRQEQVIYTVPCQIQLTDHCRYHITKDTAHSIM